MKNLSPQAAYAFLRSQQEWEHAQLAFECGDPDAFARHKAEHGGWGYVYERHSQGLTLH